MEVVIRCGLTDGCGDIEEQEKVHLHEAATFTFPPDPLQWQSPSHVASRQPTLIRMHSGPTHAFQCSGSQRALPRTSASVPPGDLLEMATLRPTQT